MALRAFTVLCVAAILFTAGGCSRIYGPVKEAKALMEAKDDVLNEWAKILETNPNEGGIERARKYLEEKKSDLMAKRDAVKNAPQGMNSDWQTMLVEHEARTSKALQQMKIDLGVASTYETAQKLDPVIKDFEDATKRY